MARKLYDCDGCGEAMPCCRTRIVCGCEGDFCHICRGETPDECDECQPDDRDEDYERQAARDRLDGFARTGGKDWT